MHRAPPSSFLRGRCSELGRQGGAEERDARGGDRERGELRCPGNRPAGHFLPQLWAETPFFLPSAVSLGRVQPRRGLSL